MSSIRNCSESPADWCTAPTEYVLVANYTRASRIEISDDNSVRIEAFVFKYKLVKCCTADPINRPTLKRGQETDPALARQVGGVHLLLSKIRFWTSCRKATDLIPWTSSPPAAHRPTIASFRSSVAWPSKPGFQGSQASLSVFSFTNEYHVVFRIPNHQRMQSLKPHNTSEANTEDKEGIRSTIRFVEATPSSEQVRKETRALIRAHASRFSWARLRIQKNRLQLDPKESLSSRGPPLNSEAARPKFKDRQRSTGAATESQYLRPDSGPDVLEDQTSPPLFESNSSYWKEESLRFSELGASSLDPFESYPSSLPRDAVSPLFDQGQYFVSRISEIYSQECLRLHSYHHELSRKNLHLGTESTLVLSRLGVCPVASDRYASRPSPLAPRFTSRFC